MALFHFQRMILVVALSLNSVFFSSIIIIMDLKGSMPITVIFILLTGVMGL
jgi:hypothetical protein